MTMVKEELRTGYTEFKEASITRLERLYKALDREIYGDILPGMKFKLANLQHSEARLPALADITTSPNIMRIDIGVMITGDIEFILMSLVHEITHIELQGIRGHPWQFWAVFHRRIEQLKPKLNQLVGEEINVIDSY